MGVDQSIEIRMGDIVKETRAYGEEKVCVVTQVEPFGVTHLVGEEGDEYLSPLDAGSLGGRVAILGYRGGPDVVLADLKRGYEAIGMLMSEDKLQRILEQLQADYEKGPIPYLQRM